MKSSQAILELQALIDKHGDLDLEMQDLGSDFPNIEEIVTIELVKGGRYWSKNFIAIVGNPRTFKRT